jgi:putative Mg2+ transporter-C (MgtC) family protein
MVHDWEWTLVGRMAVAGVLGYAIGFERELRGKSAGERTFALIGLGTAALVSLGTEFGIDAASRVIQGVAAGIGFLGAGLIFQREQGMVLGLTTAAAVWAVAAVGVLVGAGAYVAAIAGTVLAVFILVLDKLPVIRRVEPRRLREEQGDRPMPHED